MKLGLHLPTTDWRGGPTRLGEVLSGIVSNAEAAGFDTIEVPDHVWQHPRMGGPYRSQLEAYTTLGFIAAHTRHVRLTAFVTAATYRPPGLLAKMVTALDVLSGGRAMLGIGAGNYEDEAQGLGLPFPDLSTRFDVLEEVLRCCLSMWDGDHGDERPFHGRHVSLDRALNVPQSLSRPHPPILIAGGGERRTLPLVARYADACNIPPSPEIPAKLELLRRLCEEEGRDYAAIEKTAPFAFDVGPHGEGVGQLLEQLHGLWQMGIETVHGWLVGVDDLTRIEIMGQEVIPVLTRWE